jgi:inhibitor of cysteine peptidase
VGCAGAMSAPTATPTPSMDGPVTSDDPTATPTAAPSSLVVTGEAKVDSVEFMVLESFPVQIRALVKGNLPDGCTTISEVTQTRDENHFTVKIATVRPANEMCTMVLVPYTQSIALDVYGLHKGTYTVDINGFQGSFELTSDNILP